jgi:hypothetical protein
MSRAKISCFYFVICFKKTSYHVTLAKWMWPIIYRACRPDLEGFLIALVGERLFWGGGTCQRLALVDIRLMLGLCDVMRLLFHSASVCRYLTLLRTFSQNLCSASSCRCLHSFLQIIKEIVSMECLSMSLNDVDYKNIFFVNDIYHMENV